MTTLEFSWFCAQGHQRARAWRGHFPLCLFKRGATGAPALS